MHEYACEQCHQLLWLEDSWSSASSRRGEGGGPRYKEGCEPTWGKESQEEAVWWRGFRGGGGVIEDKGRQMGQTMGHRQPPGPSTTPASFRLHLSYTYKLRVDLRITMWWGVLMVLPGPPSLVPHLTDEGRRLARRFRPPRPSPVVLKVRLGSLFSGFQKQAQLWESPTPPTTPSPPSRLPGPQSTKVSLARSVYHQTRT